MLESKISKLTDALNRLSAALEKKIEFTVVADKLAHWPDNPEPMTDNERLQAGTFNPDPEADAVPMIIPEAAETEVEPESTPEPANNEPTEAPTEAELQKQCMALVRKDSSAKTQIKDILTALGVKKLKDLDDDGRDTFASRLTRLA